MKKIVIISILILIALSNLSISQSTLKEYKAGHSFKISLPDYMSKTSGLNSSSAIQYKNVVKDVYGFVISDTKEDLALVEMKFSSINEFYDNFIVSFLKDEEKRIIAEPKLSKKNDINFLEVDVSYYDKEAKVEIYYLIGIVETKTAFYKVLSWSTLENKDKFKSDFQKILYSLKD